MDILTWAYFHGPLALMAHRFSILVFPNRYQLSFAPGLEFDKYSFQRCQMGVEFHPWLRSFFASESVQKIAILEGFWFIRFNSNWFPRFLSLAHDVSDVGKQVFHIGNYVSFLSDEERLQAYDVSHMGNILYYQGKEVSHMGKRVSHMAKQVSHLGNQERLQGN